MNGYRFRFNTEASNFHQIHPRLDSEQSDLQRNFEYMRSKFSNPEIHLFARVFNGDFSLGEANQILKVLVKIQNNPLSHDYIKILSQLQ